MGHDLLVKEEIEAGEEFAREFNDYVPVAAAFWINPADSEKWYLYIASTELEAGKLRDAYGEVIRRIGINTNQWLDALQIKLLNASDPLAVKVVEIRDHYPRRMSRNYDGTSIAGMAIDGAYIYPTLTAAGTAP